VPLEGKEFDPHVAEAVDVVEGEKDNIVVEVLRKAYEFNGKLLRVGQVKVSKTTPGVV
jgi:molecular chaperone GrpE (heat shock protein)